ncbi:MAG TPA: DUF3375 domain-containing protein [Xanthobacteraceae bacterium]|jgi:hypothetical protein|nr:DUF3375 domain-containing protein [Xanthobacteraceae bacterium]
MDYRTLETLRHKHPAWRLLNADHASLIIGFLYETFIRPNLRTLSEGELVTRLEDYLFSLRADLGEDKFPREAAHYLDNWASDEHAWLRKYYPPDSDEVHFDLTPATERAIDWVVDLGQRRFVGTESRLMAIFDLLHQLVQGTEMDPWARISELERRKQEIDQEIAQIRDGALYVLDATRIKERFSNIAAMARGLLSDFREVEQNFRDLDRAIRERIATWDGGKGALLDEIFGERDAIADSDQGKSFRAFWDFLMSPSRQSELTELLARVFELDPVQELKPDRRLLRIHYDWVQAGEVTQRTVARLSEQLRRYLDDKAWQDNRRIMKLVRDIEQHALAIRDAPPSGPVMELDEPAPDIALVMDRPLFSPPLKARIDEIAADAAEEVPSDALFNHIYVDKERLAGRVRRALQTRSQVSLVELVEAHPLEQGLAELVAYMSLAAADGASIIDDARRQTLTWTDNDGRLRQGTLPMVMFCRPAASPGRTGRQR